MSAEYSSEGFRVFGAGIDSGLFVPTLSYYPDKSSEQLTELRGLGSRVVYEQDGLPTPGLRYFENTVDGVTMHTELCFTAGRVSEFLVSASVRNDTGSDIYFHGIDFDTVQPLSVCGDPALWSAGPIVSDEDWSFTLAESFDRCFGEYLAIFPEGRKPGMLISPTDAPVTYLRISGKTAEADGKKGQMSLRISDGMDDVLVRPGEERRIQSVSFRIGTFDDCADALADNLAAFHGSRNKYPVPLHGWCSWYSVNVGVTEQHVLDIADFFAEHVEEYCPDFIQIDDGYQIRYGDWEHNDHFPDGFGKCVEAIRKTGARPGIWMAPVVTKGASRIMTEHPEYRSDKSLPEPSSLTPEKREKDWYNLDVTRPEVREFISDCIKEKLSDGFTYFKIDFNNIFTNGRTSFDPTLTSLEAYRKTYAMYRELLGEDCYLLSCSGLNRGCIGYADACRGGTDSCAHWDQYPLCIHDTLRQMPLRAFVNRKIFVLDPDVSYLHVKWDSLTDSELRIWHSFVGISGQLEAISDLKERCEQYRRRLSVFFPACRETARPVYPIRDCDNTRIGFNARRSGGDFGVYLLWNPGAESADLETKLSPVLAPLGELFHVFSFWDRSYLGVRGADFTIGDAPSHTPYLLRFTPVRADSPQVIGTDLHLSMGATEILEECPDSAGRKLSLTLRAGAEDGSVFFTVPEKMLPEGKLPVILGFDGCEEAEVKAFAPGVYELVLRQRRGIQNIVIGY